MGLYMVLCSVDDVRSRIYTSTLSDMDILNIITDVTIEVLDLADSTDESNSYLQLAGKYASYAATLRKMRTTGEMAANKKSGNSQEQNTIDQDISTYESKSAAYIKKYIDSTYFIVSGRMGYGTVNDELP